MTHVRCQSAVPTGRGVFVLVNGLAAHLALVEDRSRRDPDTWYRAHLADSATVDPKAYDRAPHPTAAAWSRASEHGCPDRVAGYLDTLAAHRVSPDTVRSASPGRVIYADVHQIVIT